MVLGMVLLASAGLIGAGRPAHALTNCTVADSSLDGEEQAFLGLLNAYRQQNGLNALSVSTNLNRDAAWMVNDLATNNYFSHTDSLGRSAYQRAVECGYPQGAGENLAAGTAWNTAQAAFDAWKASPGHNANMLGSYYLQVGIARVYNASSTYGWYWATEFGAVNDGTGGAPPPANTPTPMNTATPTPTAVSTPPSTATPSAAPSATSTPAPPPAATPTMRATSTPTTAPPSPTSTAAGSTATPARTSSPLPLSPGANLVAWPSEDMPPARALGDMSSAIAMVYAYDPGTGTWRRYSPSLPSFLNNLDTLRRGAPYWVIARATAQVPVAN